MKSLKAVGAEAAVVKGYNALAVDPKVLDCDYSVSRSLMPAL